MCLARYVECITAANVCSISQLVLNTQSTVLVTVLSTNATFLVASKQKEEVGHELFSGHGMAQLAPIQPTDSVQIQALSYFLTENELLAQTTEAYTSTYGSAEFTVFLLPFHLGKHWQMVSFLNFISVFTPDGE